MGHHKLFENEHNNYMRHYRKHYPYSYEREYNGNEDYYPSLMSSIQGYFLMKLRTSRRLRIILLILFILLAGIIICLLFLIIPFLSQIIDAVSQDGIKGILETLTGFIRKLWTGA
jgi:GT2 family glycosyltransferase